MKIPHIDPDDEVLTAKDIAVNAKRSPRWAQKMFELGEIHSFMMGRERVCLKSSYHEYLHRLIAREAERLDELANGEQAPPPPSFRDEIARKRQHRPRRQYAGPSA